MKNGDELAKRAILSVMKERDPHSRGLPEEGLVSVAIRRWMFLVLDGMSRANIVTRVNGRVLLSKEERGREAKEESGRTISLGPEVSVAFEESSEDQEEASFRVRPPTHSGRPRARSNRM